MGSLSLFMDSMDWWGLGGLAISVVSALLCITLHELSHGYVAYRLGDPTAKLQGRLTLNPARHIDPAGLIMMVVVHVGWAKPVPVNMRNFKNPKSGMALTALAGPASNFIFATISVALFSFLFQTGNFLGTLEMGSPSVILAVFLSFLSNFIVLNVGLGLFNLIPISPLDGSKILFSFLPDKAYMTILRYERFVMIPLMILVFFGVFSTPLSYLIVSILQWLCNWFDIAIEYILVFQDLSNISWIWGG